MDNINLVHFLRYDQCCELGFMYGYTDLSFAISGDHKTLYILEEDLTNNTKVELTFSITQPFLDTKTALSHFLVEFMSHPGNFFGRPEYVSSEFLSEMEFKKLLERSINIINERESIAMELTRQNELIQYCYQAKLDPEPEGSSPTNWRAKCASGGHHYMLISTQSNQWGCGYCKRKGGLVDLQKWVEEKKEIS